MYRTHIAVPETGMDLSHLSSLLLTHLARGQRHGRRQTLHRRATEGRIHPGEVVPGHPLQAQVARFRVHEAVYRLAVHNQPDSHAGPHRDVRAGGLPFLLGTPLLSVPHSPGGIEVYPMSCAPETGRGVEGHAAYLVLVYILTSMDGAVRARLEKNSCASFPRGKDTQGRHQQVAAARSTCDARPTGVRQGRHVRGCITDFPHREKLGIFKPRLKVRA